MGKTPLHAILSFSSRYRADVIFATICTWITPIIQNISLCQLIEIGVATPFSLYSSLSLLAPKLWFLTNLWFEGKFTAYEILSDIFNILSLPVIQISIMSITLYFLWIYEFQKNRRYKYQSEMLWGSNYLSMYHRISQSGTSTCGVREGIAVGLTWAL